MIALAAVCPAAVDDDGGIAQLQELKQMSLEDLLNLQVSTVSRKDERWWTAPSGIDVITGDDIRRSAALTLPDALRLGTGVHVGQSSARSWAVSVRGMNVLAANKITVAMDGRSLFTPFFSGVNWAAQDTLLEDIDRIEVVRGPVGALWGAYAVNGFIQVLTKPAWDTQGTLVSVGAGTEDPLLTAVRYGGQAGKDTFYRVYAKYYQTDWTYNANGRRTGPAVDFLQTGFRVDSLHAEDTALTLQGDYYTNRGLPLDTLQAELSGANVLGRWHRTYSPGASLQVESYIDHTYWLIPTQFEERRTTVSGSGRYRIAAGRSDFLIGADLLVSWDDIGNIGVAQLIPSSRRIYNAGLYLEHAIRVTDHGTLTWGVKGERNAFSGFEWQPTLRYGWTPNDRTTWWGAVSRAVRTPVRVDQDLFIGDNTTTFFAANRDFGTEEAWAYELGVRRQIIDTLTVDVSAFSYTYDHIRSTEPTAGGLPYTFGNGLNARSSGGEVTVLFQPWSQLFIKASYRYLDLNFTHDPGSLDVTNGSSEGNDPRSVGNIGVHLNAWARWEFDANVRWASALPNPVAPGYTELDLRVAWRPTNRWELALSGRNLLHRQHIDFVTTNSLNEQLHRSVTAKVTWRY